MPIRTDIEIGDVIEVTGTLHEVPAINMPSKAVIPDGASGQVHAVNHNFEKDETLLATDIPMGGIFNGALWLIPAEAAVVKIRRDDVGR